MSNVKISIPLILVILLVFVLLTGGTMPYFLFYVFMLTVLIPLIHCLITLLGLEGYVKIPQESLFTGDIIDIEYQIVNKSILRIPYMEIQKDIIGQLTGESTSKTILSLEKKESYTHRDNIVLKRRGYYKFGEVNVKICDVFKFFSFKKKIASPASLIVYPEIIKLSTFNITANQQSGELSIYNSAFQDKSRVVSLRDYREGDSIKSIHWKLSAKKGSPIVKDYENRVDTNAVIFIDNSKILFENDVDRNLEDTAVNIAISIIDYYLNQNIEIRLETQDDKSYIEIQSQQKSDLKPFLEALAKFSGNGLLDLGSVILSRMETIKKGSTVIIITPNLDKTMAAYGIQLKMKNLNPLLIITTDIKNKTGYLDLGVETRLKQEGIPVYIIDHGNNIKEALEVHYG